MLKMSIMYVFHFFQGIIVGLDNLDAVIDIIKENSSIAMATAALVKGRNLHPLIDFQ